VAKLPWFRVYTEIVDDPKMARLSGDQFRDWIFLLALARESEEPGVIMMSPEDAAWRLRRPPDEFKESLSLFEHLEMITLEDGRIVVSKFLERQYDKPSDRPDAVRQRVARHRERGCNAAVTPSEDRSNAPATRGNAIDSDSESDSDSERDSDQRPPVGGVSAQANQNGYPTDFQAFWAAYPRKVAKKAAFKAWKACRKRPPDPDDPSRPPPTTQELIEAARNYARLCAQRQTPPEKMLHASTFLGPSDRWLDYLQGEEAATLKARDRPTRPQLRDMTDEATEFVSHIYGREGQREQAASE